MPLSEFVTADSVLALFRGAVLLAGGSREEGLRILVLALRATRGIETEDPVSEVQKALIRVPKNRRASPRTPNAFTGGPRTEHSPQTALASLDSRSRSLLVYRCYFGRTSADLSRIMQIDDVPLRAEITEATKLFQMALPEYALNDPNPLSDLQQMVTQIATNVRPLDPETSRALDQLTLPGSSTRQKIHLLRRRAL
jgi:hypothetical protein